MVRQKNQKYGDDLRQIWMSIETKVGYPKDKFDGWIDLSTFLCK